MGTVIKTGERKKERSIIYETIWNSYNDSVTCITYLLGVVVSENRQSNLSSDPVNHRNKNEERSGLFVKGWYKYKLSRKFWVEFIMRQVVHRRDQQLTSFIEEEKCTDYRNGEKKLNNGRLTTLSLGTYTK